MICPNCGKENDEARTACFNCGRPVGAAAPAVPSAPPPAPTPLPGAASGPPPFAFPPAPLAYPQGGEPPAGGPKGGVPALWAGLAGFSVVAAIGLVLFFVFLKPNQPPLNPPPVGPSTQPPVGPSTQPPVGPSTQPPPNPQPGGRAHITFAFCADVGRDGSCAYAGSKGVGWELPAANGKFVVWLAVTDGEAGDTIEFDLLDPDSGQAVVDPATIKLVGTPNCTYQGEPAECLTDTISTKDGGSFSRGLQIEAQILYKGQLVDFGHALILTLV